MTDLCCEGLDSSEYRDIFPAGALVKTVYVLNLLTDPRSGPLKAER